MLLKLTPGDLQLSSGERNSSAEEFVEDDGHAVNVYRDAESRTNLHQFWSWVLSCSGDMRIRLHRLHNLGGPEVRNFGSQGFAKEKYVFWLQISVSDSVDVEVSESITNAQTYLDLLPQR